MYLMNPCTGKEKNYRIFHIDDNGKALCGRASIYSHKPLVPLESYMPERYERVCHYCEAKKAKEGL